MNKFCDESEELMKSAVISTVTRRAVDFELRTGCKPTALYMGETEFRVFNICNMSDRREDRPQLCGLMVYKVDSISYLECS